MRHEKLPDHCPELLEERDKAVRNLGFVAMHHDSVMTEYDAACANGSLDNDLRESANVVGFDRQNAIRWLLDVNNRIYASEL